MSTIVREGWYVRFKPDSLPSNTLGGLVNNTTKTVGTGDKARVECDESKVRGIARKTASGKASEVNQLDMGRILEAHPGIVRTLSRARLLALKRHTASQIQPAEDHARVTAAKFSTSLMELDDFSRNLSAADKAELGPAFAQQVKSLVDEFHATYPSVTPQSKQFYDKLEAIVKHVEDKGGNLGKLKAHARENAHAVAQFEQIKFYHKNATIIGHLVRSGSHHGACRMIPPGLQKGGLSLLNAFGMITMVASAPLMYMSFKQMYDEMRGSPQQ